MTARALKSPAAAVDETIAWYDRTADAYVADTLSRNPFALRSAFIARMPESGAVLDAGSGSGRDTLAFLKAGLDVDAFDASEALALRSSRLTGRPTKVARFETYAGPKAHYNGVWAFASLLHVRGADLPDALSRLAAVLKPGGWMFANFKFGRGERVDRFGRRYTDMTMEDLRAHLAQSGQWAVVETETQTADAAFGSPTAWVDVFAQRAHRS